MSVGSWADEDVYTDSADNYTRLAQAVFRARKKSEEALAPMREGAWKRAYLLAHSVHDLSMFNGVLTEYPYESSIFIPTVLEQIETVKPALTESLLENDPLVRVFPLISDDAAFEITDKYVAYAGRVECLLHNQMVHDVDIEANLPLWIGDGLLYGTAWLFVDWMTRRGSKWRMQAKTEVTPGGKLAQTGQWEEVEDKDVLLEDHVRVLHPSNWHVFPDYEGGSDVQGCRFIQHEMFLTEDFLWEWIDGSREDGRNWLVEDRSELKSLRGSVKGEHRWQRKMQALVNRLAPEYGESFEPQDEDERLIRVLDHWEHKWHVVAAGFIPDGPSGTTGEKEATYKILLVEPNPYHHLGLPFVAIRPCPQSNELFGMGLVEMFEQLVHHVNVLTNLRLTDLQHAISPPVFFNTMSGLHAADLWTQPGNALNHDGLIDGEKIAHKMDYKVANNEQWQEIDHAMAQIQLAAGVPDFQKGVASQGFNDTARGISMLMSAGSRRFALQVKMIGVGLRQLAEAILKVDKQYVKGVRYERVTQKKGGDRWQMITPDDIAGDYVLEFDVSPESAQKGLQMQQILNAVQILGAWPDVLERREIAHFVFQQLRVSRPERFLAQAWNKAEWENDAFRADGYVGPVHPEDNHIDHMQKHNALPREGWMQAHGAQAEQAMNEHVQQHVKFYRPTGASPEAPSPEAAPAPGGGGGRGGAPPGGPGPPQAAPPGPGQPAPAQGIPRVG